MSSASATAKAAGKGDKVLPVYNCMEIDTNGVVTVHVYTFSSQAIRTLVGGTSCLVGCAKSNGVYYSAYAHDEGVLRNMPVNERVSHWVGQGVMGPVVIIASEDHAEETPRCLPQSVIDDPDLIGEAFQEQALKALMSRWGAVEE